MKKILVILFVSLATFTSIKAADLNEYTIFNKLNNQSTVYTMIRELSLNQLQENDLRYILSATDRKMKYALKKNGNEAAEKVVRYNLSNLKMVFTDSQYKMYLKLVNEALRDENVKMIAENAL